jgi:peptidoglycan LD-endopeptidase LytH
LRLKVLLAVVGLMLMISCGTERSPVRKVESPLTTSAENASAATQPSPSPVPTQPSPSPVPTEPPPSPAKSPAVSPPPPTATENSYRFPIDSPQVARYGRSHHDYPATDIFAPCGRPVVAVTAGTVDEISTVDSFDPKIDDPALRGGLFASIVGDDGVRYYGSHLSSIDPAIRPGARVGLGQKLGTVGDTGNAKGTGCHLHFGLSPPCGPGDWEVRRGILYPWRFLDSWRAGGQLSPKDEVAAWNSIHRAC